jgi:hypothetical protein
MDGILEPVLRYLAFALLALVGPGLAVQRLARVPPDPALVIPLGTAAAAGAWWLGLVSGAPWVAAGLLLALDGALLFTGLRARAPGPSLRGVLPAAGAFVLVLAATQYPWNRVGPQGDLLLDPFVAFDTAFHVGLTHELTFGWPPQVPGLAGFPIGYHLGTDLVRAAAERGAGVHPYDAISRLDVTLWAVALMLALRGAARAAGGGDRAVALVPWTLLATDFSFAFAGNPQAHWWCDLLRGNLLVSLAVSNPLVPALGLALGALVALTHHQNGEGRGWLVVAALQALAVPFFKVFLGAHLLLGIGLAFVVGSRGHARALLLLAAPSAVATAALVFGQGGQTLDVSLSPLDLVRETREALGLAPLGGAALGSWGLWWLFASLGVRVAGLPLAVRAARGGPPAARILAWMALWAWPLGLLFRVAAPRMLTGQKPFNDVYVLIEQGGVVLWIFTAMALSAGAGSGRRRRALVLAGAALLSLPSTVQFVWKKAIQAPDPVPAAMLRAVRALERVSEPGELVLQRPAGRYPPLPVVLIRRRVPYDRFTPWMTQFAAAADLEHRHQIVYRFFHTTDAAEAERIAGELGARYLCLYGGDRVRFDLAGRVQAVHEEPGARCYRLTWGEDDGAEASVGQDDVGMEHGAAR